MLSSTAGFLLGSLLTVAFASADTSVPDSMPPGLLFEMVDPTLCSMPSASLSDADLLSGLQAALDSGDPDMAPTVTGRWEGADSGDLMGQGYFNHSDARGLVVASELLLRGEGDDLRYVCLILAPHENTRLLEGAADVVGAETEVIDGDTFMLVAMLGERVEGEFVPLAEVITEQGSVTFKQAREHELSGYLEINGHLEPVPGSEGVGGDVRIELDLLALEHDSQMNPINWGSDDLVDAAAPAVDAATLQELRALFLDGIDFAAEPLMLSENSDMIQHDIYRYDYQVFAEQSQRDLLDRDSGQVFYHQDDHLVRITRPSTNMPLPMINALVSPDFVLDENTAEDFRDLLITLFGEDFFDDVDADPILHPRPGQWAFITGTFFDDYKAFNVFTNDEGRELDVRYELSFMAQ
ncbi:MAG: hypothetical protein FMJ08_09400 [Halomonas sp.]|nr:hypothetical protein [Halomonas sp.]TVM05409.1 MAG: hypothetical protein FMJ08_09400 [Halomonas sp.]